MRNKERLLKDLINIDDSMTIGELKSKLTSDINDDKTKRLDEDNKVISILKGLYIKCASRGTFGNELQVIHVEYAKPSGYDTDWNRLYELSGEIVSFSKLGTNIRNFKKGDASSHYSFDHLSSFDQITKDEFLSYKEKSESFNKDLSNIIGGE